MLQWILGRFDFSQNEFEKRLAKKSNRGGTFNECMLFISIFNLAG